MGLIIIPVILIIIGMAIHKNSDDPGGVLIFIGAVLFFCCSLVLGIQFLAKYQDEAHMLHRMDYIESAMTNEAITSQERIKALEEIRQHNGHVRKTNEKIGTFLTGWYYNKCYVGVELYDLKAVPSVKYNPLVPIGTEVHDE